MRNVRTTNVPFGGESVKTDSEEKECPFCPENGKVAIIAQTASRRTYAVKALVESEHEMRVAVGAYLAIPAEHHESYETLGYDFLQEVAELKRMLILKFDNEYFNMTADGGKKKEHMHYWLTQVQPGDQPWGLWTLREKYRDLANRFRVVSTRPRESRQGW